MTLAQLQLIYESQVLHQQQVKRSSAQQRIVKLKKLKIAIKNHEDLIKKALHADLRKSGFEAVVTEILFTYAEIDFTIKNLKQWMRHKRIGKSTSSIFAKNRIIYEPKGVCLIMAPWNYPFQLIMSPLVSAIAAGNCCMVKPSEISFHTSSVMIDLLSKVFSPNEVCGLDGDGELAEMLLQLPFDHIFFTGSTEIGKKVMEAAAKNLASVTLELGGKSPTIIDKFADLEKAAEKIAWGKLVNAGQTCIAPDYILIHHSQSDAFIGHYKNACKKLYFKGAQIDEASYGKIISKKHFDRLKKIVDDAIEKGARIDFGGQFDEHKRTINPVVLRQVAPDSLAMQEEIFGPVLPIVTYENLDEALRFVNSKSKPLALYLFSDHKKNIQHILANTSSGGACVNDVLIHISNPKLPFGGVNHSGMGASHGFFGFKNFSHERAVVYQSKFNFNRFIYPPYDGKDWMLNFLKRLL